MRGTEYRIRVCRTDPDILAAAAAELRKTYHGSLKVGESKALAAVMAMAHVDGIVHGGWGSLRWHEAADADVQSDMLTGVRTVVYVWD